MKKIISLISLSLTSLAFMLGSVSNALTVKAYGNVDADIFSVQVRSNLQDIINMGGDPSEARHYIVVNDHQIDMESVAGFSDVSAYNAPDYINIYMSENGPAISLSTIINNDKWWSNYWMSSGIMFPISDYDTYNGLSVYAIEILEGCTYPNNLFQTVTVQSTKKYINDHYHYEGADANTIKYGSYNWTEFTPYEHSEDTLDVVSGEVRCNINAPEVIADPSLAEYYIVVKLDATFTYAELHDYALNQTNVYEKIMVYLSSDDEGVALEDLTNLRFVKAGYWGNAQTYMFALTGTEYSTYNGSSIYKIDILAGCEFIYNNMIYEVTQASTLINPHHLQNQYRDENFDFAVQGGGSGSVDEPITLNGAQVRGVPDDSTLLYLDLMSSAYDATSFLPYEDTSALNAYDYINIYLSKDGDAIALKDVTSIRKGAQNQFSIVDNCPAFFYAIDAANYELYNGLTIYMIEVLEGCQVYINGMIAEVDKTYQFVNLNYGAIFPDTQEGGKAREYAKYNGFSFQPTVTNLEYFGEVSMMNIHNRMDKDNEHRWLMFLFNEKIYNLVPLTNTGVKHWIDKLNFLDSVYIYFEKDGEPKTLREIYDANVVGDATGINIKQFNELNMLGVSISSEKDENDDYINAGPNMYNIIINQGAQIPTVENGVAGYRTINKKTMLLNEEYGFSGILDGNRPDLTDDKGRLRLYEDWNVNWTVVPCLVTFTVQGIDGLSFPDMYLEVGQRVSLKAFAVEGYDLEAKTTDGDKVYNYIIGATHNFNIILKYTIHRDSDNNSKSSGCGGNITVTSVVLSTLALAGTALLLIRKKKEK